MEYFFFVLLLLTPVAWIAGMVKPSLFSKLPVKNLNRLKLTGLSLALGAASFLGIGLTANPVDQSGEVVQEKTIESAVSNIVEVGVEKEPEASMEEVQGVQTENSPTGSPTNSPMPTNKPTATPTPTKALVLPTSTPKPTPMKEVPPPIYTPPSTGSWSCNCSRTCTQISSCAEAYYQLNTCGCSVRDGDNDGVPCENLCE